MTILFVCSLTTTSAQLQLLNDEFDNTVSLTNWQDINQTEGWNIQQLEWFNINDSLEGHFQITPHTSSWYNDWKGALMYKEVSGDFVLTTEVSALGRDRISVPDALYSLAGIMVRSPTGNTTGQSGWSAGDQNYIFLAVGTANRSCGGPCSGQLEVKTTTNSNSTLSISNITTTHVQLRFARMGSHFVILYRLMPDGDWMIHQRYNRPDFPETLQVGFTTYTDWNKVQAVGHIYHNQNVLIPGVANDPAPSEPFAPDLIADFNFYRLDSLQCPALLNCAMPMSLNTTELLTFLDYPSIPFCPEHFRINQSNIDIDHVYNMADTISFSSILSHTSNMNLRSNVVNILEESTIENGATIDISNDGCP